MIDVIFRYQISETIFSRRPITGLRESFFLWVYMSFYVSKSQNLTRSLICIFLQWNFISLFYIY